MPGVKVVISGGRGEIRTHYPRLRRPEETQRGDSGRIENRENTADFVTILALASEQESPDDAFGYTEGIRICGALRPDYLMPSCFLAFSRAAARRYFGSDGVPPVTFSISLATAR
jgi:hypothetical protein